MLYKRLIWTKEVWSDAKQKQEHLQNIQLPEGHPLMVIKKICGSDDKIKFKAMVKKMTRTNSQENQEQDEHHRSQSRRAPSHYNENKKSGSAVTNITDHVLELARNSSTGKQAIRIFMKWKKIKNKDKRDVRLEELRSNNYKGSNHIQNKYYSKDVNKRGNDKRKDNGYAKKRRLYICSDEPASGKSRRTSVKTWKTEAGISVSTAVFAIKDPKETNETCTKSSSDHGYDTEEADLNKDNKNGNTSKSITSFAKKRRNQKRRRFLMRRNCNVK